MMDVGAALEKARRQWGSSAFVDRVQLMGFETRAGGGRFEYRVGYVTMTPVRIGRLEGVLRQVKGRGPSWEAAFEDADHRMKQLEERTRNPLRRSLK